MDVFFYSNRIRRKPMGNFKIYILIFLLSIIIAGIITVAVRYSAEIRAARMRINNLSSQVIETECGPVEYARFGDGYPVMVVHGAMGGFDQGLMLADQLIGSDFQVISVSRFGYLRSPLPAEATITKQADTFACLLDSLSIRKVAVFAVSGGATSAIRFAARHPERVSALILLSPAAPGKVKVATPPKAVFDTLLRNDFVCWASITFLKPIMQSMIGVPKEFVLTPELDAELKTTLSGIMPSSRRIDGMIFDMYISAPEFYESVSETSPYPLGDIKTPVLVINAMDDPLAIPENVRGLADQIPNAGLFVVSDGGHMLLGHTKEVKSEITRFLCVNATGLKND
jgi:pimeloyl-ACP methyl ester carboxylesterase